MKVMIVEDDPNIADILTMYCKAEGYNVSVQRNGRTAVDLFEAEQPDFMLLDLNLPGLDGIEVCRRIRSYSDVPIIMVTARTDEVDKLLGLEIGADDYVTKPFSPRELMARMRVIGRRLDRARPAVATAVADPTTDSGMRGTLDLGRLVIDGDTREIRYNGATVPTLTNKEFELLVSLARHPGRVYTKTELEEALYGCDSLVASRAVGVHISNLRAKLPDPHVIETVHGVGYKLVK